MCNKSCLKWGEYVANSYDFQDKLGLELGSFNVNGSCRNLFEKVGAKITGIDITQGQGVDIVANAEDLPFEDESFDLVYSTEMLEHVKDYIQVIREIRRVVKVNGLVMITTRSPEFPLHDYPHDYWRFTREQILELFNDFNHSKTQLDWSVPKKESETSYNTGIFYVGNKPKIQNTKWEDTRVHSIHDNKLYLPSEYHQNN